MTVGAMSNDARLFPPPAFAKPASSASPYVSWSRSGEKKIGSHPSAISAASCDVLRTDGGEVDRDVGPARVHDDLQRLAEPGRVRRRCTGCRSAGRGARAAPSRRRIVTHDLDVLARAAERLAVRLPVPALGDLRTRRTDAEQEAAAAHEVERRRGHRGHRRAPRRHLHDRGAPRHLLGVRHEPRQRRDRVGAVRLGRPAGVVPEPVGLLGELDRRREPRSPVLVSEVQSESHAAHVLMLPAGCVADPRGEGSATHLKETRAPTRADATKIPPMDATELKERLTLDAYPRSARYDAEWVADNMMGPHPSGSWSRCSSSSTSRPAHVCSTSVAARP